MARERADGSVVEPEHFVVVAHEVRQEAFVRWRFAAGRITFAGRVHGSLDRDASRVDRTFVCLLVAIEIESGDTEALGATHEGGVVFGSLQNFLGILFERRSDAVPFVDPDDASPVGEIHLVQDDLNSGCQFECLAKELADGVEVGCC